MGGPQASGKHDQVWPVREDFLNFGLPEFNHLPHHFLGFLALFQVGRFQFQCWQLLSYWRHMFRWQQEKEGKQISRYT